MKKLVAMLLVLCMGLSLCALAESGYNPFTDDGPAATEGTSDADAESVTPEGYEVYQYEVITSAEYGKVTIHDITFPDVVQARNAADDSMKIKAPDGYTNIDVKLIFDPDIDGILFASPFTCRLIADGRDDYNSRFLIESDSPRELDNSGFRDDEFNRKNFAYLVNPANFTTAMTPREVSGNKYLHYYLYDYVAQVPTEILTSGAPVYLLLDINGDLFYCQIPIQ